MSTILKALRRLEEEKAANEEPRPLREQIASAPRGALRARRTGWLAAVVALVLGIAAGGGVIWWLFGNPAAKPAVVAAAPAARAPTAVAPPALAPPAPARAGPPDQAFASTVEIVDRPDALPRLADADPVEPGPQQPKPGSVRPVETSAAAERARQAALAEFNAAERARRGLPPEAVPPPPSQPVEPVAAAQVAPPAPAPVALAPAPIVQAPAPAPAPAPAVAEAKPAVKPAPSKPAMPKTAVSVERTTWHPLADRRIAWLRVPGESEPRRVVEGDVIDGLLVTTIEPSGVVFDRDGEKIRRALGKR